MRLGWLLSLTIVALALNGCSGNSEIDSGSKPSGEFENSERLDGSDPGRQWNVSSRDGSLLARLPNRWAEVPDSFPQGLLTVASGPVSGRVINPCHPGAVLDELPEGGVLVRVSEYHPYVENKNAPEYAVGPHQPRPKHFRLGRPAPTECGSSYELGFQQSGRRFSVSIWTRPLSGNSARGSWSKPGRISPATRRQVLALLDGLTIQPAVAEPIRLPLLALDCRNPPNTLDCDRVWVNVGTRISMKRLWVRIQRWSVKTPDGWTFSDRVSSRPTWLRPAGARHSRIIPPVSGRSRTVWTGVVSSAGLRRGGAAFKRALPAPGERWIGVAPRIRADVEVIEAGGGSYPDRSWRFRHVHLIAGHG